MRIERRPWSADLPRRLSLASALVAIAALNLLTAVMSAFAGVPAGCALGPSAIMLFLVCLFNRHVRESGVGPLLSTRRLAWRDILWVVVAVIAIATIGQGLVILWKLLLDRCGISCSEEQGLLTYIRSAGVPARIVAIAAIVTVIPLTEELLFRRLLYQFFLRYGTVVAVLSTALVFSASHLFLLGVPTLIWFGIVVQCVYLKTGNLAAPILTHALYNATVIAVAMLSR